MKRDVYYLAALILLCSLIYVVQHELRAWGFRSGGQAEGSIAGVADASGKESPRNPLEANISSLQEVPSNRRSREAVARVSPSLIRDLEAKNLTYGAPLFIRLFKEERELEVCLRQGAVYKLFRTYEIAAMSGQLGPKLQEGDRQAPEGFYFVTPSQMNPRSRFHLSFNLGYPNLYDRAHGRTGSALMVHENRVSIGCFAMTDAKVEEIYALADAALQAGQKFFRVHCFPFRMTDENMKVHGESRWVAFWGNLKDGYEFFERTGQPPNVLVENMMYVFRAVGD